MSDVPLRDSHLGRVGVHRRHPDLDLVPRHDAVLGPERERLHHRAWWMYVPAGIGVALLARARADQLRTRRARKPGLREPTEARSVAAAAAAAPGSRPIRRQSSSRHSRCNGGCAMSPPLPRAQREPTADRTETKPVLEISDFSVVTATRSSGRPRLFEPRPSETVVLPARAARVSPPWHSACAGCCAHLP